MLLIAILKLLVLLRYINKMNIISMNIVPKITLSETFIQYSIHFLQCDLLVLNT